MIYKVKNPDTGELEAMTVRIFRIKPKWMNKIIKFRYSKFLSAKTNEWTHAYVVCFDGVHKHVMHVSPEVWKILTKIWEEAGYSVIKDA